MRYLRTIEPSDYRAATMPGNVGTAARHWLACERLCSNVRQRGPIWSQVILQKQNCVSWNT